MPVNGNDLDGLKIEVFDITKTSWEAICHDVLNVEKIVFGDKADPELPAFYQSPATVAVLLRKRNDNMIVGCCHAFPNANDDSEIVAHVDSMALLPEYQGRGLVAELNRQLEKELIKRGYTFMTMHVSLANGYAGKIAKNYENRIVETYDIVSKYGHGSQRYFKIRLGAF